MRIAWGPILPSPRDNDDEFSKVNLVEFAERAAWGRRPLVKVAGPVSKPALGFPARRIPSKHLLSVLPNNIHRQSHAISMSALGPELPPHLLAKRKRQQEEQAKDDDIIPSGANEGEKRRRVIGPAMPPAPLDERPSEPPNPQTDASDSEDDDFGPSLPSAAADMASAGDEAPAEQATAAPAKPKRDEWMMMPPTQDGLAARMDPSKQRPRGFNTGKGAKGASAGGGDDSSSWYETPEQKQKRLQDEMMGVSKPPSVSGAKHGARDARSAKDDEAAKKTREQIEKARGPSLVEQHKKSKGDEAEDDDPSKRAFDREKDMATGGRISTSQKNEMLKKASGFSSRFSGGSYL
jgi:hypothetical protein